MEQNVRWGGSKFSTFFKEENDLSKAMIDSQVETQIRIK
jgi:hypothetical protein